MKLTLKKIGQDDFAVMAGNRTTGRIMAKPKAFGEAVWLWTITGPYVPPPLLPSHDEADTLEDAKAAFKSKWDSLFCEEGHEGNTVRWIGT